MLQQGKSRLNVTKSNISSKTRFLGKLIKVTLLAPQKPTRKASDRELRYSSSGLLLSKWTARTQPYFLRLDF